MFDLNSLTKSNWQSMQDHTVHMWNISAEDIQLNRDSYCIYISLKTCTCYSEWKKEMKVHREGKPESEALWCYRRRWRPTLTSRRCLPSFLLTFRVTAQLSQPWIFQCLTLFNLSQLLELFLVLLSLLIFLFIYCLIICLFIFETGCIMFPRLASNFMWLRWPWTLDIINFLPSSDCWDCRHIQPHLVSVGLGIEPGASLC